jgi:AcrR family transcriptional regulator
MADRRTTKTKKAITKAFLILIKQKEITKITVAEICQQADIGRGTFYLHFENVYDLFIHIENDVLAQVGKLFDDALMNHRPVSYSRFVEKTAEYMIENKALSELFLDDKTSYTFLKKVKIFFTEREFNARKGEVIDIEYIRYQVAYKVTGIVGILQQWVETGMLLSPKKIGQIVASLGHEKEPPNT